MNMLNVTVSCELILTMDKNYLWNQNQNMLTEIWVDFADGSKMIISDARKCLPSLGSLVSELFWTFVLFNFKFLRKGTLFVCIFWMLKTNENGLFGLFRTIDTDHLIIHWPFNVKRCQWSRHFCLALHLWVRLSSSRFSFKVINVKFWVSNRAWNTFETKTMFLIFRVHVRCWYHRPPEENGL